MNRIQRLRTWVALCVLIGPALGADADVRHCSTCHGSRLQGNATLQAPALAGIERWYLLEQLQAYHGQQRGAAGFEHDPAGKEMQTVARQLAEPAQRQDAVRYVAGFAPLKAAAQLPAGNAANGAQLWAQHCASCHGSRAEGNAALHAPALARLNDWYLASAWGKYVQGQRGAAANDSPWALGMAALARSLPADFAINDIVTHLASLPGGSTP